MMSLKEFLRQSYTAYHVVANAKAMLEEQGFMQLRMSRQWELKEGGKYYVTKNDSSIIAFVVGDLSHYGYNIVETHNDSPALRVKGNGVLTSNGVTRINVEQYGGGLLYSLLDRPLKVCGRLILRTEDGLYTELVQSDYNVVIPSLAIHQNRTANDSLSLNVQRDMLPILCEGEGDLYSTLTDGKVVDADLFVVPDQEPFYAGVDSEFLCAPRLDNLCNVYSSLVAVTDCLPKGIAVCACFDNEEIGSMTKQGARSDFFMSLLKKINATLDYTEHDLVAVLNSAVILSVDNGHAVHPAHPEKYDVCQSGQAYMNGGVVVKHHVQYATDGMSSAIVKTIMDKNDIPYQDYYNRSDASCGSTLGLITSTMLQANTCDIGLAQLAMHSAVETVGRKDVAYMEKLMSEFFDSVLICQGNGKYTIS